MRWFLFHQPGDAKVYSDEDGGITQIDPAISEIKRAVIDDGKNVNDHPAVDAKEHGTPLLRSIETLAKAHADIDNEKGNPESRELGHRALEHLDRAVHAAEKAHAASLADVTK